MNEIAFAMVLGSSVFWGVSMDITKLCAGRLNSVTFNSVQYSVLAAVLTVLVLLTGINVGNSWGVAIAVFFGASWLFVGSQILYYCLECAPAYIVVPISNISAIWGVVFAALLLGEGIGLAIPISLAFIVVGIVLMSPKVEGRRGPTSAVILSVIVSLIFGLTQTARKSAMGSGIAPLTFLWIAALTGSSLLLLTGLLRSSFRGQRLDRYTFGVSASAGLFNQLFGGTLFLVALTMEKASTLAVVTSATIPFGFLLAIPLLRERPTGKAVAGVATIFLGVIIATL